MFKYVNEVVQAAMTQREKYPNCPFAAMCLDCVNPRSIEGVTTLWEGGAKLLRAKARREPWTTASLSPDGWRGVLCTEWLAKGATHSPLSPLALASERLKRDLADPYAVAPAANPRKWALSEAPPRLSYIAFRGSEGKLDVSAVFLASSVRRQLLWDCHLTALARDEVIARLRRHHTLEPGTLSVYVQRLTE